MTATFSDIAAAIARACDIVIATHIRPDGDCLGSALALARHIERLGGKRVRIWNAEADTAKFHYLPGWEKIETPLDAGGDGRLRDYATTPTTADGADKRDIVASGVAASSESKESVPSRSRVVGGSRVVVFPDAPSGAESCDLAIALDTSTRKRLGKTWECIADVPTILNIDHHGDNSVDGTLNYIDPTAPATGQIIYEFFQETGVSIDPEMATCLFAAISTDTGSFQYRGTDKRTFLAAAALVEAGVDVAALSIAMYDSQSKRQFDLLRFALNETRFLCDDRFAYFALSLADATALGIQHDDTEGIVDRLRAVDSVVCAAFFEEQPDGCVRVSMRSKDLAVNVSQICHAFGGGGHPLAAGARARGPLAEIVEQFSQAICHAISQRNH